jgi:hypothetical protein
VCSLKINLRIRCKDTLSGSIDSLLRNAGFGRSCLFAASSKIPISHGTERHAMPSRGDRMRRRDLIIGGLLATGFGSRSAAPKDRAWQLLLIGYAWSDQPTSDPASPRWTAFLNELRHHGYVEGRNLSASWNAGLDSWSGGRNDWSSVMDDIRRLSPDVIVTSSHSWARALSAVISTIPIVVSALSPVEQGIISSLATDR